MSVTIRPDDSPAIPEEALVVPLAEDVLLPGAIGSVRLERRALVRAVLAAQADDLPVALTPVLDPERDSIARTNLHDVGCLGRVVSSLQLEGDACRFLVEGFCRVRLGRIAGRAPALRVALRPHDLPEEHDPHVTALARATREAWLALFPMMPGMPSEIEQLLPSERHPGRLADYVMGNLGLEWEEAREFLAIADPSDRLRAALETATQRRELAQLRNDIGERVQAAMDRSQREYYLKEQLKVIRAELGELSYLEGEVDLLRQRIGRSGMPKDVRAEADRELERMARMHPESGEYTVSRSYLDWLLQMPWKKVTRDRLDLEHAESILDADHAGLERVKERVAEYLAVRTLKADMKGPILCFLGPPGVGKTSLGRSIARAMGRRFERISLGGLKDESEIRGHRRTYIGAMPGRIVQAVRRAGKRNPVIMLDEIDKVGADFRGDPASALLEALDPEQNHAFIDHYLDVPLDLSQVVFLLTANVADTIPSALHDRLEIIEIPGYTDEEKLDIARQHLAPKQVKGHGLKRTQIVFEDDAMAAMIRRYTSEAGVRGLERALARCCRKVARRIVRKTHRKVVVTPDGLADLLGPARYFPEIAERIDLPGIAVGLAWTPAGGEILFVEATRMTGNRHFRVTGQLGEVMKESAEAALSYIRTNARALGIDPDFWNGTDLHVHVPAGAIPKDGPSAGIAMTIALISLLTGRKVRADLGATGEITLRGKVLPVGGIKEKVLAARRAGLKQVLLPVENDKDLLDIPTGLRQTLQYTFVERIDDVLDVAFEAPDAEIPRTSAP